jgi:hypothetical protein
MTIFDMNDRMGQLDLVVAFLAGLSPRATHLPYLDLSQVDIRSGQGPSAGLACQLCGSIASVEVVKILLGGTPVRAAPHYSQFDAYRQILRTGRLQTLGIIGPEATSAASDGELAEAPSRESTASPNAWLREGG